MSKITHDFWLCELCNVSEYQVYTIALLHEDFTPKMENPRSAIEYTQRYGSGL
jgi:hypothetical protein